jgi:hypothetical protein
LIKFPPRDWLQSSLKIIERRAAWYWRPGKDSTMKLQRIHALGNKCEPWIALLLCVAVLAAGALEHVFHGQPSFASDWIHFLALGLIAAGILQLNGLHQQPRAQRALLWSGLLLTVWAANGLPFDLFRMARLIPFPVDWPGVATRTLALAAAIVLARIVLTLPVDPASPRAANWYGYAAFVFAMPYPILRVHWAFGGTLGLGWPGAGGKGFAPLLITIPFLLAAVLPLLLISPRRWKPRWLLLTAGWTATAIVGTIGPLACMALIKALTSGRQPEMKGIAFWVPCLFYISWFLFAIAAGAATRSYQLRSAPFPPV